MTTADRLRVFRVAEKLTQRDVAEAMRCSVGVVSQIESGARRLRRREAARICAAFHVPLRVLFPDLEQQERRR